MRLNKSEEKILIEIFDIGSRHGKNYTRHTKRIHRAVRKLMRKKLVKGGLTYTNITPEGRNLIRPKVPSRVVYRPPLPTYDTIVQQVEADEALNLMDE